MPKPRSSSRLILSWLSTVRPPWQAGFICDTRGYLGRERGKGCEVHLPLPC
jgi:hypothetical protein